MFRMLSTPVRISGRIQVLLKGIIHAGALGYAVIMFYLGITDQLGGDPVEALLHATGTSAVNFLLATLIISPAARYIPFPGLMKFRRLVGLYSFFFALLHFITYVLFELQMNVALLGSELVKRPYITVGFAALLTLLAMAATSTQAIQRRMGKRWQQLHNVIYLTAVLALLHFTWSQKTIWGESLIYWLILTALLAIRTDKWKRLFGGSRRTYREKS